MQTVQHRGLGAQGFSALMDGELPTTGSEQNVQLRINMGLLKRSDLLGTVCAHYGSCQSEQEHSLTNHSWATGSTAKVRICRPGGGCNSVVGLVPIHQNTSLFTRALPFVRHWNRKIILSEYWWEEWSHGFVVVVVCFFFCLFWCHIFIMISALQKNI